jgi:hypothetical protein
MFKDIKGYENIYQISNCGIVRRISYSDKGNKSKYKLPFYLKDRLDKDGYKKITLTINHNPKQFFVHRLVAIAFIKNQLNKKEVNHIDGNKSNNKAENLEWVTQSENRQHCLKYLNPKLKNNKLSKKVLQFDLKGNLIKMYPSAKQAMRDTGFSQGHISEVCRGEMKTYKKFIWKYE